MAKPSPSAIPEEPAGRAPKSFEAALGELEGIVAAMEAGQMPLQESLDAYRRGVELLRQCQETLGAAERQLQVLDAGTLREFDGEPGEEPQG